MHRKSITAILIQFLITLYAPGSAMAAGFDLLRIDPNARTAALGGYAAAMVDGSVEAIEVNPAGLATMEGRMATATYANHLLDLSSGRIAWAQPLMNGVGGISVTWFSYGEFDRIESFETVSNGTFSASDLLLTGSWAMDVIENLSVGASVKMLQGSIDNYNSTSAAVDAGMLFRIPEQRTTLALTISNLGAQLDTYAGVTEDLPLTVRLAGSRKLEHLPLVLTATAHAEADGTVFATGAGEFTVSDMLQVRAGYTSLSSDLKVSGPDDSTAGLTAGFGLSQNSMRLDYALYSMGALGMVHRISFGYLLP